MNRYNQGFGGFGPMEQCNDGKWVKFDDAQKDIQELKGEISQLEISRDEWYERALSEMEDWTNESVDHIQTKSKLMDITSLFYGSVAVNVILVALLTAHGVWG
mgnify:CR=1 FL=1